MVKNNSDLEIVSKIIDEFIKVRKELGISHQTLADHCKLHRSAISLIERKKRVPSLLSIIRIYKALGMPLAQAILNAEDNEK
jgi:transcriptional regulator with XRE-family HTH domain